MKDRSKNKEDVQQRLIFLLNFLQLNTIQYDKQLDTLRDILYNERWTELPRLADATSQCIKHVSRMGGNLKRIKQLLAQSDFEE